MKFLKPLDGIKKTLFDDLRNLLVDPREREERYWNLFDKYYNEAKELKDKDNVQAAEKLWGASTALIKAYAARKGVLVEHWSRRKLHNFVENNVEAEMRGLFRDLLTFGNKLHEHFYEANLPDSTFNVRWEQCIKLLEKILKKFL